ncbi:SpoIIIAH-like family protein [Cohnella candidum]|uniref:SpoIIIAH-like family protein n=1 Tax=Cohnella candidum TaxID=2674991 RepID=A0A3G3JX57_9BACL|nr:SpoIIIAH-like family protein [Cohnella candidum]AYQ72830.1 SpoIIIAH-like family protein [Cohnella candidum]
MNNKRQTIWLVSMLSLMVILSAYYLFTEDVTPSQSASGTKQQTQTLDSAGASGKDNGIEVIEEDATASGAADAAGGKTDSSSAQDEAATSGDQGKSDGKSDGKSQEQADGGTVSPADEAVLNEYTNLKGSEYFDQLQRLHEEKVASESEKLSAIIADTKNHTQEQASSAVEELARLEDTDSRMTSLEEKLLQDYDNAVVTEDEMNFKVVVQASKLEKKQAVKIIDLASKELNVSPSRLSVQYVP